MFNIFGAIGQLGRILPGYTDGYRSAISDNWNDLNQYNQVQNGQIGNAFMEATFNPRVNMQYHQAAMSGMGVEQAARNNALGWTLHPYQMQAAATHGPMLPALAGMTDFTQIINFLTAMRGLGGAGQQQTAAPGRVAAPATQQTTTTTPAIAQQQNNIPAQPGK